MSGNLKILLPGFKTLMKYNAFERMCRKKNIRVYYHQSSLEKDELKVQIQDLRSEIERQQKQNETLLLRVDDLSTKMEELESQEPVVSMNRITKVLNSLFERLK